MGLDEIRRRIEAAEVASNRKPGSVTLIAVSKQQPAERIDPVLDAGQRVFGENYVQEAQGRWPELRERYADLSVHMIGPLQSNKARAAIELFDAIHSVDRLSLAERLARIGDEMDRRPEIFIQVNTGAEPQKAGVLPSEADTLIQKARDLGLDVQGCMCIPPDFQNPIPHFRLLREIAERNGLAGLSMGMSADFEVAIAEGATHIRVGSAIFGARTRSHA